MYSPEANEVSAFDAKTHLSHLLTRVQKGSRIIITKHNMPVAVLSSAEPSKQATHEVINQLLIMHKRHTLDGLSINELKEEGRR